MTQFKPELIQKILAGEKTQTRRLRKSGDEYTRTMTQGKHPERRVYQVYRNNRLLWQCGKTYAVCPGRGKPQVARFKLQIMRWEDVRQISGANSRAEGFRNRLEFWLTWCGFHDPKAIDAINHALYHGLQPIKALNLRSEKLYQAWALTFKLEE